ncbi:hypothetical protein H5410_050532 [Solanum commersonii]|uniref:Uncharacterized protein n=1 Tax=Solanum commersonii TaxID=4109 RepID=A0A9J5WVQ3_SOLCO|nr:hypothetical protein H5410_050532 [Solanum commersonii]
MRAMCKLRENSPLSCDRSGHFTFSLTIFHLGKFAIGPRHTAYLVRDSGGGIIDECGYGLELVVSVG